MKIHLLSADFRIGKYENQRFEEEAKASGIELEISTPNNFEIVLETSNKDQIYHKEKNYQMPDVFLSRHTTSFYSHMISRHFEQNETTFVVNPSIARQISNDKLLTIQHLSQNNIPVPKSILAKFPLNTKFIEKHLTYPIIVKKTKGSEGKGIVLCENKHQLEDLLEMLEDSTNTYQHKFILQEFIDTKKGQDIRVFVIGGRAIGAMLRTGKDGDFKANYSGGGSVTNFELTPEIEWLATESAKVVGLNIAGVDLLFDKEGYKICEINASPYFEGFEQATGINIPQEIFNYLQIRLGERIV